MESLWQVSLIFRHYFIMGSYFNVAVIIPDCGGLGCPAVVLRTDRPAVFIANLMWRWVENAFLRSTLSAERSE